MTTIELSVVVNQAKEQVYNLLKNLQEFPMFMRDIKKLEIIEKKPYGAVTLWEIDIEGTAVTWKEEDTYDDSSMSMQFRMIEGDYGFYSGKWQIASGLSKKSIVHYSVNIGWGMPSFEKVIGHILEKKQRRIIKSMLVAMKRHLEKRR